jgi:hypothetical protein
MNPQSTGAQMLKQALTRAWTQVAFFAAGPVDHGKLVGPPAGAPKKRRFVGTAVGLTGTHLGP